ncbi:MAG: hypothetical protein LC781_20095, partial [Actinobacteria bacterium]|nr:hypothetical protein [Actinomycetota bacterium]
PQRAIKSLPEAPANTVPSVYEPTTTISNKPPITRRAEATIADGRSLATINARAVDIAMLLLLMFEPASGLCALK